MPVTAKLSSQFYDKLGDEITNELVEWLNQVNLTYRTELRELNESNSARSDAKVDQRFAEFELKVDRRLAEFEAKFNHRLAELDAKFSQRLAELDAKFDRRLNDLEAKVDRRSVELEAKIDTGLERLRSEMVSFKAELIKWMFLFWLGTVATTLAIVQLLR